MRLAGVATGQARGPAARGGGVRQGARDRSRRTSTSCGRSRTSAARRAASASSCTRCGRGRASRATSRPSGSCSARPRRSPRARSDDRELAEAVLRDLIAEDEGDVWALEELTRAPGSRGRRRGGRAAPPAPRRARGDGAEALALKHEAARVVAGEAERPGARDDALRGDPRGRRRPTLPRATALRRLYAEAGRYKDLAKLLAGLVDVATTQSERAALRLELAQLQNDRFAAPDDAIETLRGDPRRGPDARRGRRRARRSSTSRPGRDAELADLLKAQLDAARDRADVDGRARAARAPRRGAGGPPRGRDRRAGDLRAGPRARRRAPRRARGRRAHQREARGLGARGGGAREAGRPLDRRERRRVGAPARRGAGEAGRRERRRGGAPARAQARARAMPGCGRCSARATRRPRSGPSSRELLVGDADVIAAANPTRRSTAPEPAPKGASIAWPRRRMPPAGAPCRRRRSFRSPSPTR